MYEKHRVTGKFMDRGCDKTPYINSGAELTSIYVPIIDRKTPNIFFNLACGTRFAILPPKVLPRPPTTIITATTCQSIAKSVCSITSKYLIKPLNDFTTAAGNGLFTGLPPMQGGPNTGADENGVIHDALNPFASFLNVPDGFDLTNFNFNSNVLYPHGVATVTISAVPVPAAVWLMGSGLLGLVAVARRRSFT